MLLVDPGMRRKGIGTQLLRAALEVLQEEQSIKLDATPAGRLVYLNMGFRDEYPIRRMMAERIAWETLKPGHARPIQRSDFDRLMEYDRTVFGADREALLRWIWTAGQPFGYLVEEDGKIAGYCFGRPGHQFTHIGPVVAQQPHHAVDLLSTALKACGEQGVILDTLLHSPSWLGWLTSCGFVEQRNFMRMVYGPNRWPGVPELSFAILGPEFG
jgi:GNAT superfamily N-acetyltransferase